MKKSATFWLVLLLSCFNLLIVAQQPLDRILEAMNLRNIGPAGMSGRVTAIDVNPNNPEQIYIGTASGGVWRSNSGGVDWTPLFDKQPLLSIGALALNPQNPDEIWAGTGEGNPRNSHNSGAGIYKSIDGGKTWKCMGLQETRAIHRIYTDPHQSGTVYVAALGSAWGPNPERGVYKTINGGETWEHILSVNDSTGCADLVIDPQNPNKLIAAMWEYGRKPWFFNSGGSGSGLYLTYDGGKNWKKLTAENGLPKGNLGRIGLAIAPSRPEIVYALVEAKENALYRSTDGGETWEVRATKNIGNRPFYYADIFVDPQNENRIFNLWSYLSVSEDGGKSFEIYPPFRNLHPDHHAFWIHPQDPDYMIEGNDGGLNISRDGGRNWRYIENLPLGQFYHVNYDMEIPYNVYGGLQDNGSWTGPAYTWKAGGITNYDFQELLFGDGFDVMPNPANSRYVYAMYQGGNLYYVDKETGKSTYIQPRHPEGSELRFNWNAALAQNPFHDCGVFFGSQFLHKSLDCGQSWEIISPDLTTNDTSKQKQHLSGGLTIDDTRAENFTTILSIAPSPLNEQVIWVGTDDGNLQLTQDGGATWQNLASGLPDARPGSWIPQIVASSHQEGEAFVIVNDYRRNDWRPMAYHTDNFGKSWTRIVDEKQVSGFALSIAQDPEEPTLLFLGTDQGLYISFNKGADWVKKSNNFPSAPVRDLKIHPRENDLIIATFGRSIWILDDITPLRKIAADPSILDLPLYVFDPPTAYQAEYRSHQGVRFLANGGFRGANRSSYPRIRIWVNTSDEESPEEENQKIKDKPAKKAKKQPSDQPETDQEVTQEKSEERASKPPKDQKVKILVFDEMGDTVRQYSQKLQEGLNMAYWDMCRNGVNYPSERDISKDDDPPRGMEVKPGTYKLQFFYGDFIDSTYLEVQPDPRLPYDASKYQAKLEARLSFDSLVTRCRQSMDAVREAKKTVDRIDQVLDFVTPDSLQKQLREEGKTMRDSLGNLLNLFRAPDVKGIQRTSDKLISILYDASSMLNASDGEPNQMARFAVRKATSEAARVLERVNTFFAGPWKAYRQLVENTEIPLFKPDTSD